MASDLHAELRVRLEAFSLDDAGAALTFTQRLARENGWSGSYAKRVVQEYKRFLFLAMAVDHPVTPSEPVDEAWHLHLTYTRSYWQHLCGEVLQKPLHHHPTRGGKAEAEKFGRQYQQTLDSYRKFFYTEPPGDIWPPPGRAGKAPQFAWVDIGRHWLIPKPQWSVGIGTLWILSLFAALAVGCGQGMIANGGIFDLRGPDFLLFFVIFGSVVFVLAGFLRRTLQNQDGDIDLSSPPKDFYVMAALQGGPARVTLVAITSLVQQGLITVTDKKVIQRVLGATVSGAELHPVEKRLFDTVGNGSLAVRQARERLRDMTELIDRQLEEKGWLLSGSRALVARWIPLSLALLVPIVGLIKIAVGLQRNKPVGILAFLEILTGIFALVMFASKPRRSRLGDRVAELMREANPIGGDMPLSGWGRFEPSDSSPEYPWVPMAVALYGVGVLSGTPFSDLSRKLGAGTPGDSLNSGGSGGGCGTTSSCGGDSGGRGGGDGGGSGCGGCSSGSGGGG